MRIPLSVILFLCLSCLGFAAAANWSKDDHEIFDLVSQIRASEGKAATFYSYLNVTIGATDKEIARAYKKRSLELHPDKNPNVKDIDKRFARLGLVNNILKDGVRRERYNFFYKNGVPVWRGTAYLYSRFRPTVLHVILLLVAISSGVHWLLIQMKYRKDRARLEYFDLAAKRAAGGGGLTSSSSSSSAGGTEKVGGEGVIGSVLSQVNGVANGSGSGSTTPTTPSSPTEAYGSYGENSIQLKQPKTKKDAVVKPLPASKSKRTGAASAGKEKEERRRKVKVPMTEGVPNGQMNEFIVVDGEVFWPTGEPLYSAVVPPTYMSLWPIKTSLGIFNLAQSYLTSATSTSNPSTPPSKSKANIPKVDSDIDAEGPTSATEDEFDLDGEKEADGEGEQESKKPRKKGLGKAAANKRRQMKK